MKAEIRKKLNATLARDQAKRDELTALQTKAADDAAARKSEWSNCVTAVILPAMQPIADTLVKAEWVCDVRQTSKGGASISAYRGEMHGIGGGQNRPELNFDLQDDGAIKIYQSTPFQGAADQTPYPISQITEDFIHERVLRFVDTLAMK
jgi:hypothetical protein